MSKNLPYFSGNRLHNDKPLLYYSRKTCSRSRFSVREVDYNGFASEIKGNADKMREALEIHIHRQSLYYRILTGNLMRI